MLTHHRILRDTSSAFFQDLPSGRAVVKVALGGGRPPTGLRSRGRGACAGCWGGAWPGAGSCLLVLGVRSGGTGAGEV